MRSTKKYMVIGAGISGATAARLLAERGNDVIVIEKDTVVGGQCKTIEDSGIMVHVNGPHIFHTDNEEVWKFVNRFADFNEFINMPKAMYHGRYYSLPFNLNTFEQIFGTDDVAKVKAIIRDEIEKAKISFPPKNLEEQAISMVGTTIYERLVKHYTEKQWGRDCKDLSPDIIKRLPLRFEKNDCYFNDKHQGIPEEGYTKMVERMLDHENIEVITGTTYDIFSKTDADEIIYTGRLDTLIDTGLRLPWRALRFKNRRLMSSGRVLPSAVVNRTDDYVKHTRVTEHRQFMKDDSGLQTTILTYEYPCEFDSFNSKQMPSYPISNERTEALADSLKALVKKNPRYHLLGRLATYRYLDMDDAIYEAMRLVEDLEDEASDNR